MKKQVAKKEKSQTPTLMNGIGEGVMESTKTKLAEQGVLYSLWCTCFCTLATF